MFVYSVSWSATEEEVLINIMCQSPQHLKCLEISNSQCKSALQKALVTCGKQYVKEIEVEIYNPVCVTNKWIGNIGAGANKALYCDKHVIPFERK